MRKKHLSRKQEKAMFAKARGKRVTSKTRKFVHGYEVTGGKAGLVAGTGVGVAATAGEAELTGVVGAAPIAPAYITAGAFEGRLAGKEVGHDVALTKLRSRARQVKCRKVKGARVCKVVGT